MTKNIFKKLLENHKINKIIKAYSNESIKMNVFDRKAKLIQKERASLFEKEEVFDYLKEEVGWRVSDRILDIKRTFPFVLDLGCNKGFIGRHLMQESVGSLIQCDLSFNTIRKSSLSIDVPTSSLLVDEELLPFRQNLFDLVLSSLSLHWVNDLPGTFKQVHNILKKDGCFLGSMIGGDTLHELRVSLYLAEMERKGGFSPHISPFTSPQDVGSLLQRAGFVMLTIDIDDLVIQYPSMFELLLDLRGMAESGCAWNRPLNLNREVLLAASAIYKEKFGYLKKEEGKEFPVVPALFQVINFIAWKPDESQLQPAKRGSAQVSMKDLASTEKILKEMKKLRKDAGNENDKIMKEMEKAFGKFVDKNKLDTNIKKNENLNKKDYDRSLKK